MMILSKIKKPYGIAVDRDNESEGRAFNKMPLSEAALHTEVQAGKRDS